MHHIYHTEGIILGSRNYGETGKCYYIFTRDLGLIFASAQGVRKLSSKLRYVLQDFSYIKVDFVKGKEFWRITTANKMNINFDVKNIKVYQTFSNIGQLLKKLLMGEEKNQKLFEDVLGGFVSLSKEENNKIISNIEIFIVLKILNNLGYVEQEEVDGLIHSPFELDVLENVFKDKKKIIPIINKALRESQM